MKLMNESLQLLKTPLAVKIAVLGFASVAFFYLGQHFSSSQPLVFYNSSDRDAGAAVSPSVAVSPNANLTFNEAALIPNETLTLTPPPTPSPPSPPVLSPPPPHPPVLSPPAQPVRFGIVDENGTMTDDFDVGEFDPDLVERWDFGNETSGEAKGMESAARVRVKKYRFCDRSMREYIPCLDNVEEIKKLKSTERGERFERHCPKEALDCLVPVPKGYKVPIPWPRSRDEV